MSQASLNSSQDRGSGLPIIVMGVMLALAAVPVVMMAWPRPATAPGSSTVHIVPAIAAERQVIFDEKTDGSAAILDASDRSELAAMKAGEGGFARTLMRLLVVERRRHDVAADAPFRVTRWNTGSVTILDPTIGKTIELKAFGASNAEAFAQLLETRRN